MPYCTQQNLIDRYGEDELIQLTDRTGTGLIDATVIAAAIADAGALLDGYLAGRYALPLASTPPILTNLACDLARYQLYDDATTPVVQANRDSAIRYLEQVATGKIPLVLATGATESVTGSAPIIASSAPSAFDF